jgi:hypothetical protein
MMEGSGSVLVTNGYGCGYGSATLLITLNYGRKDGIKKGRREKEEGKGGGERKRYR